MTLAHRIISIRCWINAADISCKTSCYFATGQDFHSHRMIDKQGKAVRVLGHRVPLGEGELLTADRWLLVLLEIIVDKPKDERRL